MNKLLILVVMAMLLGGCVLPTEKGNVKEADPDNRNHFDKVTLQPGDSAICMEEPCAVYFVMPSGEGELTITGNNVFPESFPAGQTVFLGSYWGGSYTFHAEGTDTPVTYLTVITSGLGDGDYSSDR
jgi:hypothetical protein